MTRTEEVNAILAATVKEIFEDFVHSDEFAQKIQEKVGVCGKVTAIFQLSSIEGCIEISENGVVNINKIYFQEKLGIDDNDTQQLEARHQGLRKEKVDALNGGNGGFGNGRVQFVSNTRKFSDFYKQLSTIYQRLLKKNLMKPKRDPIDVPFGSDMLNFCEYHQVFNHHSDDCRTLMNRIQDIVDSGPYSDLDIQAIPSIHKRPRKK